MRWRSWCCSTAGVVDDQIDEMRAGERPFAVNRAAREREIHLRLDRSLVADRPDVAGPGGPGHATLIDALEARRTVEGNVVGRRPARLLQVRRTRVAVEGDGLDQGNLSARRILHTLSG